CEAGCGPPLARRAVRSGRFAKPAERALRLPALHRAGDYGPAAKAAPNAALRSRTTSPQRVMIAPRRNSILGINIGLSRVDSTLYVAAISIRHGSKDRLGQDPFAPSGLLSLPRLQHRLNRNPRPGGNLVAERHVGIVHLARLVALGGKFTQHVARRRARRGDEIGRKGAQLRVVARLERRQRFDVEALHLGQREGGFRGAGVFDDRFHFVVERFPRFQGDDAFAGAVRLVEAGAVIERREAVKAERDVGAGADEFGAVDDAGLQRHQNFAGRCRLWDGAEPAINFAAEAERTDFQTLHVVAALELAAEPAAHAHPG